MSFFKREQKRIFLDYASMTPMSEEVKEAMIGNFANPSALYKEGILAKEALGEARSKIGRILNAQKSEVIFTSGGTEGNNMALLGVFEACRTTGFIPHIVTTTIEHSSILETCAEVERRGGEVTYVPVNEEGIVNPKDIVAVVKENTVLISVMYANNEIGAIQPIREIGKKIKEIRNKSNAKIPYLHTDACQSALYLPLDVQKLNVDLMTLDGIKMHGPRGAGVLYVKRGVAISPATFGGGQEKGLRSGTENLPNAIGFAKALEIAEKKREEEGIRLAEIRDYGIEKILTTFPKATLNGSADARLPNNINICFPGLDAEFAVISLDVAGIAASYSSSCQILKENSSSYVVSALGKKDCEKSSLRFTLGQDSKKSDMDTLVVALEKIIKHN